MPDCIVIGGLPCAGKSTLSRTVGAQRDWPVLAKDDYKELVFDRLGARDDAWSRQVGVLAWDLLFREAELLLAAGGSCVLEGNFRREHGPRLRRIAERVESRLPGASSGASVGDSRAAGGRARPRVRFVEIRCRASGDVLLARFRERVATGERHPGHDDAGALARIGPALAAGELEPLDLGGAVLDYDSSTGLAPDALLAALDAVLASRALS
jgi:predicted kinase